MSQSIECVAHNNSSFSAVQRRPKVGRPVMLNTELANSEPLLLGTSRLGACKPLLTMLSSSDQHLTSFYVCFCLKTSFKIRICRCISTERMARTHAQKQLV